MEFIPPLLLVVISFFLIISIFKKIERLFFKTIQYRQSDIHKIFKKYLDNTTNKKEKRTQMSERLDKNSVSVVILDDKAYWVVNNMFYNADFISGEIKLETTMPIDTDSLSKEDLDKMLLILDKLGNGNNNDSGSAG